MIGASIVNPRTLFFMITGDLSFFYDMNILGNRHVGNNVRLMVINNGVGQQFRNPGYAIRYVGEAVNEFVAAAGHFGNKSKTLLKNFAEDLGFEYLSASTKDEYMKNVKRFCDPKMQERPMVYEVFTDTKDETAALEKITSLKESVKSKLRNYVMEVVGAKGITIVKKLTGKY